MCCEPINEGQAQIDVLGRTAGCHVHVPTFWKKLPDCRILSFEGQGRASVGVAADELFGSEGRRSREQEKSKQECTHEFLPCCYERPMIAGPCHLDTNRA